MASERQPPTRAQNTGGGGGTSAPCIPCSGAPARLSTSYTQVPSTRIGMASQTLVLSSLWSVSGDFWVCVVWEPQSGRISCLCA